MPKQKKAHFDAPFPEIDYEEIARSCGCTLALSCNTHLIVVGDVAAIKTLEANLSYSCEHVEDVE